MRLFRSLLVGAVLAATAFALPVSARADTEPEELQTTSGELLLPTRFFLDPESAYPGLGRRLYNLSQETNGIIVAVFNVDPDTLGGRFVLESTGDLTGLADLGIYFYTDMADVGLGLAVTTGEYDRTAVGGEEGAIPANASKALVFMKTGADALFTYRGFAPQEIHIGEAGFDPSSVDILAGQKVVWVNDEPAFHGVTSDGLDAFGDRLFDSSPEDYQPIVKGARFSYTFTKAGTYTYFDRFTGATGAVNVTGTFGAPS